ncbi:hypothetical protein L202_05073 [Cryptococcus amylolentus CBS 6039]|uniref:Uncharacterized protein n=1 Tax=Cryptococcus amylolentus CBS 6039 TaxID=1295533 RepID=A0A1E3HNS5_9TREE|nr:hypothetical protein L202_05073 [Cryptococcus amylolentus CBS 6039]ODN77984.1 hypothetical protein L202_05073 [Cryptococcus amylolentus CBS 6039]
MLFLSLLPALLLPLAYALPQPTTDKPSPSASNAPAAVEFAPEGFGKRQDSTAESAPEGFGKRQDSTAESTPEGFGKRQDSQYSNIKFLSTFPDNLSAKETISLKWEGGDGLYNLYERVGYPGEEASVSAGQKILVNSTLTELNYTIGNYPVNSSIVFGVKEHTQNLSITVGQEQSRVIPIV